MEFEGDSLQSHSDENEAAGFLVKLLVVALVRSVFWLVVELVVKLELLRAALEPALEPLSGALHIHTSLSQVV